MQGIYKITYIKNRKCYVGSSVNINNRWNTHKGCLKQNKHHSQALQNIYNKYGLDALRFEIIEEVQDKNKLIEREQYWINTLNSYYQGFNGCRFVDCRVELTKEQKDNISIKTKEGMNKPEVKEKCRQSKIYGKTNTAKLIEQQVEEIKIILSKELINRRTLAKQYNITVDAIDDIISGHTWSYVRPDLKSLVNTIHKLSKEDVIEIKTLALQNVSQSEIAKKFNICQQTVSDIIRGKNWNKIGPNTSNFSRTIFRKLTKENIVEIKSLIIKKIKTSIIAKKFNVSWRCISDIKNGHTWKIFI